MQLCGVALDRTFISTTTDLNRARYFAGENGVVYKVTVPKSSVIFQPNPNSTENEVLIRIGCGGVEKVN